MFTLIEFENEENKTDSLKPALGRATALISRSPKVPSLRILCRRGQIELQGSPREDNVGTSYQTEIFNLESAQEDQLPLLAPTLRGIQSPECVSHTHNVNLTDNHTWTKEGIACQSRL